MTTILRNVSPGAYNGLPSVDVASEFIYTGGLLAKMADSIGGLLVQHDLNRHWAVALLHNHWNIRAGEAPIEHVTLESGARVYTMKPIRTSNLNSYAAGLIRVDDDSFQALEFSSDSDAHEANELLLAKPVAVADLIEAFRRTGLRKHFGLSPALSAPRPGYDLVETSLPGRVSMTKEEPEGSTEPSMLLQTAWTFDHSGATYCTKRCKGISYHRRDHDDSGD